LRALSLIPSNSNPWLKKSKLDLRESEESFDPVEIDVGIKDKVIPKTLVDNGSGINIMLMFTMRKLGLEIIHPSRDTIKCLDQRLVKTLGRIKDLMVQTGGVNYLLTFEVIPLEEESSTTYPLLLGQGFLCQCSGVVNWVEKQPTFTYGPDNARTMVAIVSKGLMIEEDQNLELDEQYPPIDVPNFEDGPNLVYLSSPTTTPDIELEESKEWDLSPTLTLEQPTSSSKGKRVLCKTKTPPTFKPYPFASTTPPIESLITIKDLSGSFHPPTEWD